MDGIHMTGSTEIQDYLHHLLCLAKPRRPAYQIVDGLFSGRR
jgi:hypothetical protein